MPRRPAGRCALDRHKVQRRREEPDHKDPMQIHLDAVGGVAGDMVVAALLDAFPEHEAGVRESGSAAFAVCCAQAAAQRAVAARRRQFPVRYLKLQDY